jgi:hypothetical protein
MSGSKDVLAAMKRYVLEWWFTLVIGYVASAVGVFLFCVMMTIAFIGFSGLTSFEFWSGVVIYESILVVLLFLVIFLGSYRKKKTLKVQ